MKRTLTLKSETLTELTGAELSGVVGGAPPTVPLNYCHEKFVDTMQPTRCLCPS